MQFKKFFDDVINGLANVDNIMPSNESLMPNEFVKLFNELDAIDIQIMKFAIRGHADASSHQLNNAELEAKNVASLTDKFLDTISSNQDAVKLITNNLDFANNEYNMALQNCKNAIFNLYTKMYALRNGILAKDAQGTFGPGEQQELFTKLYDKDDSYWVNKDIYAATVALAD